MELKENNCEFITGQKTCTLSLSAQKYINKVKKLYSSRSTDFTYYHENPDGSVCCTVPLSWFKISPPKKLNLTDEQRQLAGERLRAIKNTKNER